MLGFHRASARLAARLGMAAAAGDVVLPAAGAGALGDLEEARITSAHSSFRVFSPILVFSQRAAPLVLCFVGVPRFFPRPC